MALCMWMWMCVDLNNDTITTNQHQHGAPAAKGCQWPFITQGHKDFKLAAPTYCCIGCDLSYAAKIIAFKQSSHL